MTAAVDAHQLRSHLLSELRRDVAFDDDPVFRCVQRVANQLHLAVMTGPYLDMILSGIKTVESRFHRTRQAPLFSVSAGDVLAFKRSGGAVEAVARVDSADYLDLEKIPIADVRTRWQERLGALDDDFWAERAVARWVSLFELVDVRRVAPLRLTKRDRRPWVVYDGSCCREMQPLF